VHGLDGIDEISLAAPTKVTELRDGWTRNYSIDPKDYGFELCAPADLKGGDAGENAGITLRVLEGEPGPKRDVVLLNAAAAIFAAGLAPDYASGLEAARASIDSGKALSVLEKLRALSSPAASPKAKA
jgi:anthranilate phosphoribosyltransferase